jgi:hypothetical protein
LRFLRPVLTFPLVLCVQGDVLYVPTYWLHYLVTLSDMSYQCNTRSGGSTVGLGEVRARARNWESSVLFQQINTYCTLALSTIGDRLNDPDLWMRTGGGLRVRRRYGRVGRATGGADQPQKKTVLVMPCTLPSIEGDGSQGAIGA